MVRSSTALASTKSGLPLPFTQMKSSSARCGNSTSPRTRSCDLAPRPRRACGSAGPGPRPAAARGHGSARRSPASGRRPPPAALVRSSISSRVQAQAYSAPLSHSASMAACVRRLLRRLEVRPLVGRHAEPVERGDDPVGPLGPVARLVGVLNAQDERAAVLAHEEPVEQRGPRAADVEVPGRRRGEARPGRGGRVSHAVRPAHPERRRDAGGETRRQSSSMEMAPVGQPLTASRRRSRNSSGGFSLST